MSTDPALAVSDARRLKIETDRWLPERGRR
jgi:hypothetical protein